MLYDGQTSRDHLPLFLAIDAVKALRVLSENRFFILLAQILAAEQMFDLDPARLSIETLMREIRREDKGVIAGLLEMRTSMIVLTAIYFFVVARVAAQSPDLVAAAKKEGGKVVIYGSLETPVVDAVIQAFRRKTGLDAQYWRASAMSVMNRSMSEYRAGNPIYDAI